MPTATATATALEGRIEASALSKALQAVLPFVANTGPPITSGVRLVADAGVLRISCTTLDTWAHTTVDMAVSMEGEVVVPARVFAGFVKSLAGAVILRFDPAQAMLHIECGSATLDLRSLPAAEWPRHDDPDGKPVDITEDWPGIKRVIHASRDNDDTVAAQRRGVHFAADHVVATDTARLAAWMRPGLGMDVTVPNEMIHHLAKTVTGKLEMLVGNRVVAFTAGPTTWCSRPILGDFPDWQRLMRKKSPSTLTVSRVDLLKELSRLKLMAAENGYRRAIISRIGDEITLEATGPDVGTMSTMLPCRGDWQGEIAAEIPFLYELADNCTSDDLDIGMGDTNLKQMEVYDGQWVSLVMPVNVASIKTKP